MLIWHVNDDGLAIAREVFNAITLIHGIIWNSYGSEERWVGDYWCSYYPSFDYSSVLISITDISTFHAYLVVFTTDGYACNE